MSSFPYLFPYFRFKIISYTHIKIRLNESLLIPIFLSLPQTSFNSQHPKPFHSILISLHHTTSHTTLTTLQTYPLFKQTIIIITPFYPSQHLLSITPFNIIYQMSLYQIPPHHSLSPRKNHTSKRNPAIHCPSNHSFS